MPLAHVLRVYRPNDMNALEKLGLFFARIGEFVSADPRADRGAVTRSLPAIGSDRKIGTGHRIVLVVPPGPQGVAVGQAFEQSPYLAGN